MLAQARKMNKNIMKKERKMFSTHTFAGILGCFTSLYLLHTFHQQSLTSWWGSVSVVEIYENFCS